jgi:CubicO group peptidase (beta-lactamase class C family)
MNPTSKAQRREHVDQLLAYAVDSGTLVQVAGLAADARGHVYEGVFGCRDAESGQVMTLDSVCWLGSCTKALTVIAAMQLVERGELGLDQPAGEILSYLKDPLVLTGFEDGEPLLRPAAAPVTVRHLLTHTAGFTYADWNPLMAEYEAWTRQPGFGDGRRATLEVPLVFDPGTDWSYGIGIDQVGRLVEEVSGLDLETYLKRHVLEPLGMHDTGFRLDESHRDRLSSVYRRQPDGCIEKINYGMPQDPEFFMGGSAAYSTPSDFLRLLRMILGRGTVDGVRILDEESVRLVRTPSIGHLGTKPLLAVNRNSPAGDYDRHSGPGHSFGLSFDIHAESVEDGRAAGSISWCGLLNAYYWVDFSSGVTGLFLTQILPFPDRPALAVATEFEKAVYAHLG